MMLSGKISLVTGSAAGIGAGIADLFAREGSQVVLADIDRQGAEARAEAIRSAGGAAVAFGCDVSDGGQVQAVVDATLERFGRIDVLINNAGVYPRQTFLGMTEKQWDTMHDINLKSVFHTCHRVVPGMVERGSGHIVNISSVTFFLGAKALSHYVATKGAIIGFTRSLARELGEHNVYVNCITPGAILTEGEVALNLPQSEIDIMVGYQSLKRRILPEDIARACVFLSTDLSSGVTGQTLNVDGGWIMH